MDEVKNALRAVSKWDKEPVPSNVVEDLEDQRNMEMEEKISEPSVINSVLVEAGINPFKCEEDCNENERYYEAYLI